MAVWPSTLPAALEGQYREVRQDALIRSQSDMGPAKVRRRYTATPTVVIHAMYLSDTELATLNTFYDTTITGGALSFSYPHPRTGATVTARFAEPYEIQKLANYWSVACKLEILP
jgi:hypothetical protein